jgi:hypothetical protein
MGVAPTADEPLPSTIELSTLSRSVQSAGDLMRDESLPATVPNGTLTAGDLMREQSDSAMMIEREAVEQIAEAMIL